MIDIPVQAFWPAEDEITRRQANGREALEHCGANRVWSLVGAAGGVWVWACAGASAWAGA